MTNDAQENITIDLNNKDYAFLDASSNLQLNAFKKVDHIVNDILANDNEKNSANVFKDFKYQSKNNVIYIQGSRGAGKTTFLKYVIQYYHNNKEMKVKPFAFIDPTTISTQQHILTEIVSKLNNICFPVEGNAYPKNNFFEEWNKQLSEISKGMELLSSKNTTSNPHDSAWFLGKALNNSTSGQQLEHKLHKLINIAIKHLGAKSLLIAIDDIDTQTEKAYELLETIRCYLTHPKLIVLLSGDLELYSHIVSEHKYNEIMINYNKDKFSEKDDVRGLVNQLEQQYLIKVLPLTQRVRLEKLIEILNNRTIKIKTSNNTVEVKSFLSERLSSDLGVSEKYISKYRDFILSQPIRTVVQLLSSLTKENNDETLENQLRNLFIRDFTENRINLDLLEVDDITPSKLGYETVKLLDAHNDLETGFYCRPDSENEGYNALKLFLSTLASEYISRNQNTAIGCALNVMLAIGATSSIYLNFVKDNLEQDKTIEDYLNYIELGRGDRILSLVEHFSPICLNPKTNNQKMLAAGVFRTLRRVDGRTFDKEAFLSKTKEYLSNRDKLREEINKDNVSLFDYIAGVSILLSSSANITNKGETRDYVSIYTFIAAIAELLNKEEQDKLKTKLSNLLDIRTYSSPSFIKSLDKGDDDNNDDEGQDGNNEGNNEGNYEKLCNSLTAWISSIPKEQGGKISLLMLGKIWTRIFYSINNISNDINRTTYLGEAFAIFVWGVCNSILIEEVRYNNNVNDEELDEESEKESAKKLDKELVDSLIMAKNVSTSIGLFTTNLSKVCEIFGKYKEISFKQKLPITYSILSCPLLYPFLVKKSVLEENNTKEHLNIVNEKSDLDIIEFILNNLHDESSDKQNELNNLTISHLPMVGFFTKNKSKNGSNSSKAGTINVNK